MATLDVWLDKFRAAVAACMTPGGALKKGEWCRWCPALVKCPEQHQVAIAAAKLDFAKTGVVLPAGDTLTAEQIGQILEQKPVIESWLSAIAEHAKHELEMGHDIPGFKIVAGRGARSWGDKPAAEKFLVSELGDKAFSRDLLSVSQAEKCKVKVPEHLVKYSPGASILAPESDKRAPKSITLPASDFAVVEGFSANDF